MASTFEQQSRRRKLIYLGAILVLFTATLLFRMKVISVYATDLGLREQDLGDVELTGSAVRLSLTGSRGLAVCFLWQGAIEKQKKQQWNELELLVNSLIKLQPHFITPWLFQSWNLAYNVAVESDSPRDKYFYITRGIELLSRGERQNKNHPDLRYTIGFYLQHKIGLSDEHNTFRSLFALSRIDPRLRDPNRFRAEDGKGVNLEEFRKFCEQHPMLIRRLRESGLRERKSIRYDSPQDVVAFLTANYRVPGLYEDVPTTAPGTIPSGQTPLKSSERFPVLPPQQPNEPLHEDNIGSQGDDFDNFAAARAWFVYSNLPLPPLPQNPKATAGDEPFDKRKHRKPRYLATLIFRQYPARSQCYIAENFAKEGWFDEGWEIGDWFSAPDAQGNRVNAPVVLGGGRNWTLEAWVKAYQMIQQYGLNSALYKPPVDLASLRERAKHFQTVYNKMTSGIPFEMPAELRGKNDPQLEESYEAHKELYWYEANRRMTNFPYFYHRAEVESRPVAAACRKTFFKAEGFKNTADYDKALSIYLDPVIERPGKPKADSMTAWRDLMLEYPEFRNDSNIQEESYEIQLKFMDVFQEHVGKNAYMLLPTLETAGHPATTPGLLVPSAFFYKPQLQAFEGPFDGVDAEGVPLISRDARDRVRGRTGAPAPVGADLPGGVPPADAPKPPAENQALEK